MISEFGLGLLLVFLPLVGGATLWAKWEFTKSESAFQSFSDARREMIATGHRAKIRAHFGDMSETIELYSLAELDQGPKTLSVSDLGHEVSQLSEDVSHSWQRLRELASTKSSTK